MSLDGKISWENIKVVANALDSYRIRVLIDAKQNILDAGKYSEEEYEKILLKLFDEERQKHSLLNFIKTSSNCNFESMKQFSEVNSMEVFKTLSFLELLDREKLVSVEIINDMIKGDDKTPDKLIFKDFSIKVVEDNNSRLKPIYEPVKVIFESESCSGCGLCAGVCPMHCLELENGNGKFNEEKCIYCGLCYFVCPRSYLPTKVLNMAQENATEIKEYSKIGPYIEVYSARTKIKEISAICQDGGVTSTCLTYLLSNKHVDQAIGAKMTEIFWRPEPFILNNKEDVLLTAGTKYVNNPNLQILNRKELKNKKLAIVGVPCQMQALLKSHIYDVAIPSLQNILYRIGIFCMESFSYESLLKICEKLKVDIKKVKKMDINKGKFFVYTNDGEEFSVPIKEISHLGREDCEVCFDLTSESADISIGSIGAPAGWNCVIIRTQKGKELYEALINEDLIESKPISEVKPGLPLLQRIAGSKRTKSQKHVEAKKNKNIHAPTY